MGYYKQRKHCTVSNTGLLNLFNESETARIKWLITGTELEKTTPNQLLLQKRTVAGADASENLIKTLWLQKMPNCIANVLLISEEDLNKLVVMADKISYVNPKTEIFAASKLSKTVHYAEAESNYTELLHRITNLEQQI